MQLHDYLDLGSDIFLVMEYCNGGDMGDYLAGRSLIYLPVFVNINTCIHN